MMNSEEVVNNQKLREAYEKADFATVHKLLLADETLKKLDINQKMVFERGRVVIHGVLFYFIILHSTVNIRQIPRMHRISDIRQISNLLQIPSELQIPDIVEIPYILELLKKREDLDFTKITENDSTFLHSAAVAGNEDIARWLIEERGFDTNQKNRYGNTPLHVAAIMGHLNIVKLLLRSGANFHEKGKNGMTAFQMAVQKDNIDVAQRLLIAFFDDKKIRKAPHILHDLLNTLSGMNIDILMRFFSEMTIEDWSIILKSVAHVSSARLTLMNMLGSMPWCTRLEIILEKNQKGMNILLMMARYFRDLNSELFIPLVKDFKSHHVNSIFNDIFPHRNTPEFAKLFPPLLEAISISGMDINFWKAFFSEMTIEDWSMVLKSVADVPSARLILMNMLGSMSGYIRFKMISKKNEKGMNILWMMAQYFRLRDLNSDLFIPLLYDFQSHHVNSIFNDVLPHRDTLEFAKLFPPLVEAISILSREGCLEILQMHIGKAFAKPYDAEVHEAMKVFELLPEQLQKDFTLKMRNSMQIGACGTSRNSSDCKYGRFFKNLNVPQVPSLKRKRSDAQTEQKALELSSVQTEQEPLLPAAELWPDVFPSCTSRSTS